jgi:predicted phage gp36 major capsid-like protein
LHDPEKREEVRAAKAKSGSVGGHTTLTQSNLKPWRGTAGEVTVFKSPTVAEVVNLLPLGQDMTDFFTGEATKKTVTV